MGGVRRRGSGGGCRRWAAFGVRRRLWSTIYVLQNRLNSTSRRWAAWLGGCCRELSPGGAAGRCGAWAMVRKACIRVQGSANACKPASSEADVAGD